MEEWTFGKCLLCDTPVMLIGNNLGEEVWMEVYPVPYYTDDGEEAFEYRPHNLTCPGRPGNLFTGTWFNPSN